MSAKNQQKIFCLKNFVDINKMSRVHIDDLAFSIVDNSQNRIELQHIIIFAIQETQKDHVLLRKQEQYRDICEFLRINRSGIVKRELAVQLGK